MNLERQLRDTVNEIFGEGAQDDRYIYLSVKVPSEKAAQYLRDILADGLGSEFPHRVDSMIEAVDKPNSIYADETLRPWLHYDGPTVHMRVPNDQDSVDKTIGLLRHNIEHINKVMGMRAVKRVSRVVSNDLETLERS